MIHVRAALERSIKNVVENNFTCVCSPVPDLLHSAQAIDRKMEFHICKSMAGGRSSAAGFFLYGVERISSADMSSFACNFYRHDRGDNDTSLRIHVAKGAEVL